jgi:hypothetical protein
MKTLHIVTIILLLIGISVCFVLLSQQILIEKNVETENLLLDIKEADGLIEIYSNLIKKIPANE